MLWEHVVAANGEIRSIQVTGSGDVIVAGFLQIPAVRNEFYLARYQGTDGASVWEKLITSPSEKSSVVHAIELDAAGHIYAAGVTERRGDNDYCVAKYSLEDGANLWTKVFDGLKHGAAQARAVAIDGNGDVVSTGYIAIDDFAMATRKSAMG